MRYRCNYFSSFIERHGYAMSFQRIKRCPVDKFWQNKHHSPLDSDLSGRWRYLPNNWDQKASLESKYWIKWELQRASIHPGRAEQNYSNVCTILLDLLTEMQAEICAMSMRMRNLGFTIAHHPLLPRFRYQPLMSSCDDSLKREI